MGNYSSKCFRTSHSAASVGDNVFVWGGYQPGLPLVHDSSKKKQFTSSVDVYNVLSSSFVKRQTTGTPPNGAMNYTCCAVGDDIYYFGGSCEPFKCHHNNLFVLDTKTEKWREIACNNGPIEKAACAMTSFTINGKTYLLVIGGCGSLPPSSPAHSQYTPHPDYPYMCLTNEVHVMSLSTGLGKWIVADKTGDELPPISDFTINVLPGNKAILFGGAHVKGTKLELTNTVFIVSFNETSVNFQQLHQSPSTGLNVRIPKGRGTHSSAIIRGVSNDGMTKYHLLVLGGWSDNLLQDCQILDIANKNWKELALPKSVAGRCFHSMTTIILSTNRVCLFVVGGGKTFKDIITCPNSLVIIELAFSNDSWSVVNTLNQEDMKDHDRCSRLLTDRLSVARKELENTLTAVNVPDGTSSSSQTPTAGGGGAGQLNEFFLQQQIEQLKEEMAQLCKEHENELSSQREQTKHQIDQLSEQHQNEMKRINHQNEERLSTMQKRKNGEIEALQEDRRQELSDVNKRLNNANRTIQEKIMEIRQGEQTIQEKDEIIQQKQHVIKQKEIEIENLETRLEATLLWKLNEDEVRLTNEKIGTGSYGEVKVAIFRGTRVAAKCLHDLIVSDYNKHLFTREMELSSTIHHPNIVQFIGATRMQNPILLYELMATSLHKELQKRSKPLTRLQILTLSCDILSALCYLHGRKPVPIIHRDISSPNVLMEPLPNDLWRGKLSDFGSANLQQYVKTKGPGNPFYASPEADNPKYHSPAMDVYSFGILLTEMVLHRAPETNNQSKRETRAHTIEWEQIKTIVLKCISEESIQRPTSSHILSTLQKLKP